MIKNIKIDGTGDAPSVSDAVMDFLVDLNAGAISPSEVLVVNLVDQGDYRLDPIIYFVSRTVHSKITITTTIENRHKVSLTHGGTGWIDYDTLFFGSCLHLEVFRCIIFVAGLFVRSGNQDVLIEDCVAYGAGVLAETMNGQIKINRLSGSPLDIKVDGDQYYGARDANGGGLTYSRPSLFVRQSRLGHITSNKPVDIRECWRGRDGVSSYTETNDYPYVNRRMFKKYGNIIDHVRFDFGTVTIPCLKIVEGGLYRRLLLGSPDMLSPTLVEIGDAQTDHICLDRCVFINSDFAVTNNGNKSIIHLTGNIFHDVMVKVKNTYPETFVGRIAMGGNRGSGASLKLGND